MSDEPYDSTEARFLDLGLELREIVVAALAVACEDDHRIAETKAGSTLRIGQPKGGGLALYAHCQTTIISDFSALFGADFEIEGPLRVFANAAIDTNEKPGRIKAVVGIFLFRGPNQILETLPLVRSFLPGSERGLVGAYFEVKGGLSEPSVEALPMATLASAVPSAIKAPFKVLRLLFERGGDDS